MHGTVQWLVTESGQEQGSLQCSASQVLLEGMCAVIYTLHLVLFCCLQEVLDLLLGFLAQVDNSGNQFRWVGPTCMPGSWESPLGGTAGNGAYASGST
jgi:hypothetical protein